MFSELNIECRLLIAQPTWMENLAYSKAKNKCVDRNQNAIFLFVLLIHLFLNLFTILNFDSKSRKYFINFEFQNAIFVNLDIRTSAHYMKACLEF